MRQIVLTENELHALVEDSVKIYLRENGFEESAWSGLKGAANGVMHGNFNMRQNFIDNNRLGTMQKAGQQAQTAMQNLVNVISKMPDANGSGKQWITHFNDEATKIGNLVNAYRTQTNNNTSNVNRNTTQNVNGNTNQNVNGNTGGNVNGNTSGNGSVTPTATTSPEPQGGAATNGGKVDGKAEAQGWFNRFKQNHLPSNQRRGAMAYPTNTNTNELNNSITRIGSIINEELMKVLQEDGAMGGDAATPGATSASSDRVGAFDVPFGAVQRRGIYNPKGKKKSKMTKVDMGPALKRGDGLYGSISVQTNEGKKKLK